jgi:hypothetical protein
MSLFTEEDYAQIDTSDPIIQDKAVVTLRVVEEKQMLDSNQNPMVIVNYELADPAPSTKTNDFGEPLEIGRGFRVSQIFWFGGDYVADTKRKWAKYLETMSGGAKLSAAELKAAEEADRSGLVVKAKIKNGTNKQGEEESKVSFVLSVVEPF